jgi:osmotically-inducible protein OsmY
VWIKATEMNLLQQSPAVGATERHPLVEVAQRHLQRSAYREVRMVECEFHQGSLRLKGKLATFYFKQLAQTAVAGVHGVDRVVNEIEVVGLR